MTLSELSNLSNSFGLKSQAQKLLEINHLSDLDKLNSVDLDSIIILGSGTNVILNKVINGIVVSINLNKI